MKIALWIVQGLLALAFLATGAFKLFAFDQAAAARPWMVGHRTFVTFTALVEITGAVGLILPGLTGIRPVLTSWAAAGLALLMILASGFHLWRGEYSHLIGTLSLFALAVTVAWCRGFRRPE